MTRAATVRRQLGVWRREPLVLFVLLGVVLFAADRLLNGVHTAAATAPIVITASQQTTLREAFRAERGREPDAAELKARLDHWIDEQVLYREALALGLDRKDLIVHRQLTQKMRFLIEDATPLAPPTETELQAWLDQHAQHYGHAPMISFDQVFLSRGRHGDALPAQSAHIGTELARAPEAFTRLGDPFPTGPTVTAADPTQLRKAFGPGFAESVQGLAPGHWSGPVASSFGLHWVRVTALTPFRPAALSEVKERVQVDAQTARHEQLSRQTLDQLRQKYRIQIEDTAG